MLINFIHIRDAFCELIVFEHEMTMYCPLDYCVSGHTFIEHYSTVSNVFTGVQTGEQLAKAYSRSGSTWTMNALFRNRRIPTIQAFQDKRCTLMSFLNKCKAACKTKLISVTFVAHLNNSDPKL
jgi:hypothetical protein